MHPFAGEGRGRRARAGSRFFLYERKGAQARVNGKLCGIGNSGLMHMLGADLSACRQDAERLSGEGKTVLYCAEDGKVTALIAVADTLKEGSRVAVAELKARGIRPAMLTGRRAGRGEGDRGAGRHPRGVRRRIARRQVEHRHRK